MNDAIQPMHPSISNGRNAPTSPRCGISQPFTRPADSDSETSRGDAQQSAVQRQRFAIITVYSLGILLALGYVPGFGL